MYTVCIDYPQYHKFSGDDKNLFQLSHSLFLLSHSLHTVYIRFNIPVSSEMCDKSFQWKYYQSHFFTTLYGEPMKYA